MEDSNANVLVLKDFINRDEALNTFHPEWLIRKTLMHRQLFGFTPVHEQTVEAEEPAKTARKKGTVRRLQQRMREKVGAYDFLKEDDSGEL